MSDLDNVLQILTDAMVESNQIWLTSDPRKAATQSLSVLNRNIKTVLDKYSYNNLDWSKDFYVVERNCNYYQVKGKFLWSQLDHDVIAFSNPSNTMTFTAKVIHGTRVAITKDGIIYDIIQD